MASVPATTNGKAKDSEATIASPKSGNAKSGNGRATKAKPVPASRRTPARPKSASPRKASSKSALSIGKVPQWLTVGASVTGAVVAVGATLFATRNEWLPRAKKLGAWVEQSVQEQLDNFGAAKAKANEPEAPVISPASTGIQ